MFDSVLSKSPAPQGNIAGLGLTFAVCVAVVVTAVMLPSAQPPRTTKPVDVTFVAAQPAGPSAAAEAPPAAAAAAPAQSPPAQRKPVIKKREVVPVPDPVPAPVPLQAPEPAPQPAAAPSPAATTGVPGGTPGGVASGVVGGTVGGTVGGVRGGVGQGSGTSVLPFGQGMTRPTQIAGKPPEYSREALAARVEGKVLVRCVITVRGTVEECKIIKGVPMLDKLTVEALQSSRFTPVLYQGRPETVQYLFTFNFKLP